MHGYPPTAVAGTEICAERLCVALRELGHEPHVLAREERSGFPEYKILRDERDGVPVTRIVNNFTKLQERYLYEYHPRIEEIFEEQLGRLKPDIVHVQHLAGMSWGLPRIAKERGLPLVISLHDYWYACERVQLLRPDGTICPGPDGGRNCALYCAHGAPSYMASAVMQRARFIAGLLGRFPAEGMLLRTLAALQPAILRRRTRRLRRTYGKRCERLLGALASADAIVSPSEKARSIYGGLGIPEDRITVIPHGAPPFPRRRSAASLAPYDGRRPLALGYTGTVMPHKGVTTILKAVRKFSPDRVRLNICGRAYPASFAAYVSRALKRFPRGQVELHGTYQPDELQDILAGVDILIIPSLWHETFNLVLWEAWAAGIPVLASRVGALADFVRDGEGGLTFDPGDWRGLRGAIMRLIREPAMLESIRSVLPRCCISLEENARRYESLYKSVLSR